jgi:hypothetical protein
MLKPLAHGLLGIGVHHEYYSMFIGQRTAQRHSTLCDERVHERRVLGEAGLLTQWQRRIPRWAVSVFGHEEGRHLRTLASVDEQPGGPHGTAVREELECGIEAVGPDTLLTTLL